MQSVIGERRPFLRRASSF